MAQVIKFWFYYQSLVPGRLCHINMLKPYHEREAEPGPDCVASSTTAFNLFMRGAHLWSCLVLILVSLSLPVLWCYSVLKGLDLL